MTFKYDSVPLPSAPVERGIASRKRYKSLDYVESGDGSIIAANDVTTNRFFSGTGRDDDPPSIK